MSVHAEDHGKRTRRESQSSDSTSQNLPSSLATCSRLALLTIMGSYLLDVGRTILYPSRGTAGVIQKFIGDLAIVIGGLMMTRLFPGLTKYLANLCSGGSTSGGSTSGGRGSVYNLDHAILNVEVSKGEMWMNMGYWKSSHTKDFSTACPALLLKVLQTAGILQTTKASLSKQEAREEMGSIELLDIGIGCGDQTKLIVFLGSSESTLDCELPEWYTKHLDFDRLQLSKAQQGAELVKQRLVFPRIASYVGITNDQMQCEHAQAQAAAAYETSRSLSSSTPRMKLGVLCADGSKPTSWSQDIRNTLSPAWDFDGHREDDKPTHQQTDGTQTHLNPISKSPNPPSPTIRWLLGLDSLYHLSPSRLALFEFAHRSGASIAAFDLLLPSSYSSTTSHIHKVILYLICLALGTPRANLMTPAQYRTQLMRAGYRDEDISIEDISVHVFGPLADFLLRKDVELKDAGIKAGIGKFRAASRVFGWWARSGIVRGCVVVAKAR